MSGLSRRQAFSRNVCNEWMMSFESISRLRGNGSKHDTDNDNDKLQIIKQSVPHL